MSEVVIKVENISKQYRLGEVGTGSFANDMTRWWYTIRGKENPFLKIGEENKRSEKGKSNYVWSLRDVNFEIYRGESIGVIGRNGAGKSTLLKILSQVTSPSTGTIKTRGRIASLLEVGTGFHPDLTGKENIFLNGAILGMQKAEIKAKFDEIVDFSGVERYIDTPVKRYSSGMYVRLAFAVAAHLEPDILIIDEVLAVGDAEFQKKCLGKMKDVTGQGRTILFVSHNMSAVNSLCNKCIYLSNGTVKAFGDTASIINKYLSNEANSQTSRSWLTNERPGDEIAKLDSIQIIDEQHHKIDSVAINKKIGIQFNYEVVKSGFMPIPNVHVFSSKGEYIFVTAEKPDPKFADTGKFQAVVWVPANLLNEGMYIIGVALSTINPLIVHFFEQEAISFEVIEDINKRETEFNQTIPGVIRPQLDWNTSKIS